MFEKHGKNYLVPFFCKQICFILLSTQLKRKNDENENEIDEVMKR